MDGHPVGVLIGRTTDADLLVVGARGEGGFTGLLTGSVSEQCVRHAACSVMVVPAEGVTASCALTIGSVGVWSPRVIPSG